MVVSIEKGAKNISEKFFYDFDDFDTDVLNRVGFDVHGLIEMDLLKRSSTEINDWQGKKKVKVAIRKRPCDIWYAKRK